MNTATLNVTFNGQSSDIAQLDYSTPDRDVIRVAEESMGLAHGALSLFVVDRFNEPEIGPRLYVRPKVPFG